MLSRKTNPINWHFASKRHIIDLVKWQAVFRRRWEISHQDLKSGFSAMDAKMIHELVTADDENVWLTVHIILIARAERRLNIWKRRISFKISFICLIENWVNFQKCATFNKLIKKIIRNTFLLFSPIHIVYQVNFHLVNTPGKVLVVQPVMLAVDIYCNCAIPTAKGWPCDPYDWLHQEHHHDLFHLKSATIKIQQF